MKTQSVQINTYLGLTQSRLWSINNYICSLTSILGSTLHLQVHSKHYKDTFYILIKFHAEHWMKAIVYASQNEYAAWGIRGNWSPCVEITTICITQLSTFLGWLTQLQYILDYRTPLQRMRTFSEHNIIRSSWWLEDKIGMTPRAILMWAAEKLPGDCVGLLAARTSSTLQISQFLLYLPSISSFPLWLPGHSPITMQDRCVCVRERGGTSKVKYRGRPPPFSASTKQRMRQHSC